MASPSPADGKAGRLTVAGETMPICPRDALETSVVPGHSQTVTLRAHVVSSHQPTASVQPEGPQVGFQKEYCEN